MKIEIMNDPEQVAQRAAALIEEKIRVAIREKGSFSMAISGGRTPWEMLKILAQADLPWTKVNLFQVDERVAPDGHPDRNLTQLFNSLENSGIVTKVNVFPMPVTHESLPDGCAQYQSTIHSITGNGMFDLIHLGMGADGHTASLVPGDPVCDITDQDVAMTAAPYQGRLRMTLTYPMINQAKEILWIITGSEKTEMLKRLTEKDHQIPAGRINQERALVLTELRA